MKFLRLIPGSNTAESCIHLKKHTLFKITTHINSGIPELTITNVRTEHTQWLLTFIDDLLPKTSNEADLSAANLNTTVVTQAGAIFDIAKYVTWQ